MPYPKRYVSTHSFEVGVTCNIYQGLDPWFDVQQLGKVKLQSVQLWGKQGEFEDFAFSRDMQGFSQETVLGDLGNTIHVFIGGILTEFDSAKFMVNLDLRVDQRTGTMTSSCTFSDPPPSSLGCIRVVLELVRKKDQ